MTREAARWFAPEFRMSDFGKARGAPETGTAVHPLLRNEA
jgi:hypothetical protein